MNTIDVDDRLHSCLVQIVREAGPQALEFLTRRARVALKDARIDREAILDLLPASAVLTLRPCGDVDWTGGVLEGSVLTHRTRADLTGRSDLWCGVSLQPLLNMAAYGPIPLRGGGEVRRLDSGQEVLVGPDGWLPPVPAGGLVGLRLVGGELETFPVDADALVDLEVQQRTRELLAHHFRMSRWFGDPVDDSPELRAGEMAHALQSALLEDAAALRKPHPPLVELLFQPLRRDAVAHHFRDVAAWQEDTIGFWVQGLPMALHRELEARARAYGMSFDQYVTAVLGHLAWRTPFAEDLGPWEDWDPDAGTEEAAVISLAYPSATK